LSSVLASFTERGDGENNRRQRRPQFMGQDGEESILRLVGPVGIDACLSFALQEIASDTAGSEREPPSRRR
jgi:hypothetical protein